MKKNDNDEEKDLEKDLFEDDDFLEEYRRKRLEEMKRIKHSTFGFVQNLTRNDFVDCIDKENPNVTVVIHLYQEYIPVCIKVNKYLQTLAISLPHIKFAKILSIEADPNFDDIALPAFLVYKAGNFVGSLLRITDDLGNTFDVDHLEGLFNKNNIR